MRQPSKAVRGPITRPICSASRIMLQDAARAMRFVRTKADQWNVNPGKIGIMGSSAGGHLAAAMVGTDWPSLYPKAPAVLTPAGYAISGLYDLTPLLGLSTNQDLRLTAEDVRKVSPAFWPIGPGRTLDAVVGSLESSEFKRQSQIIVQAWQGVAKARYEEIVGTNHFTACDPLTDPQSAMVARIAELAVQVKP